MKELWQNRSSQAAEAPDPSPSARSSQEPLPARDRRIWLVAIPLALIVIYAFIPAINNGFVVWDDDQNFLDNPYFRGLGPAQVKWAWTTFLLGVYQPLAWLLFGAQYVLWQLDPRGYHLTSLLLHVGNAVVLYVLTVAVLVRCRTDSYLESPWTCSLSAGIATALFMVHPLRVEAVAWASCQPYLPCALFSMLAVLAYLRAFRTSSRPRWGWLAGSFVLFVAALLFKAVAVSLPAVLLILDVYPLRRFRDENGRWFGASARRALWEKVPFVIVSLFFMGLAFGVREQALFRIEHYDRSEGIAQACYGIWFYIRKTVLPRDLTAVYPLPRELNWLAFPFSLSILATLAMSAGLFFLRRRWPGLLAAWLSYLVILAPNAGLIRNNTATIAADRYSYMAMLGLVIVAAAGFCRLWRMFSRAHPGAAIGIVAIGLGTLQGLVPMTRNQCRTWLNSETLWGHVLTHGANTSDLAHYNLGNVYSTQGKYEAAVAHFTEALRLNPRYAFAHNNLGAALQTRGSYEAAEAHFTESLRLNPANDRAHNNLGKILSRRGNYEEAEAHYTAALRLNPGYFDAHVSLGSLLNSQGKYEAAAARYTEALRLSSDCADAHSNLATILSRQRRYAEAESHFAEALRLQPDNANAHYNLGVVLFSLGNYEAAKAHFGRAIRLQPGDPDAFNASATIMAVCPEAKFRDGKRAVEFATRSCELTKWKDPGILNTLAAAYAEAGDFDAAVSSQKRALELQPDERQKDDYRSRLVLYQAKRPYRQVSPVRASTEARP